MSVRLQDPEKYQFIQCLEESGISETWLAEDTELQRDVLVKLLHPSLQARMEYIRRFLKDAQKVARLQHPNIVQVYDIFCERDVPYMVTATIEGPTLAEALEDLEANGRQLSSVEILQIAFAIGSALDYAHAEGVVHGDLRPEKIFLDQRNHLYILGEPLVTDFCLAHIQLDTAHALSLTEPLYASSFYLAPEQLQGGPLSVSGDLYAFGIILYELFTGEYPFDLSTDSKEASLATLSQVLRGSPIVPSLWNESLSPELDAFLLQCLAKNPEERFPNVCSLLASLTLACHVPISRTPCMSYHIPLIKSVQTLLLSSRKNQPALPTRTRRPLDEEAAVIPPQKNSGARELAARSDADSKRHFIKKYKKHGPYFYGTRSLDPESRDLSMPPPAPPLVAAKAKAEPTFQTRKRSPKRLRFIALLSLVSSLFISAMLLWPFLGSQIASHGQSINASRYLGQLSFLSSGQGDKQVGQGLNDQIQVSLTHLDPPAAGKSYYAWLLGDTAASDMSFVYLGKLSIVNGAATLIKKDPPTTNFLATLSRFLITEESSSIQPSAPSLDRKNWRALGTIPQQKNSADRNGYSFLDHLRHLLAFDPSLQARHLPGGLANWLTLNADQVRSLAQNARDTYAKGDSVHIHNQLVRLLYLLDGSQYVNSDLLPADVSVSHDAQASQIGLLQVQANQDPPSYLYHIGFHLQGISVSPGVSPQQQKAAISIKTSLDFVQTSLQSLRSLTKTIVALPLQQLSTPQVKDELDQVVGLASQVSFGEGKNQPGVQSLCGQLSSLATIDISSYF